MNACTPEVEAAIPHTIGQILRCAEEVNRRHGGALGTWFLEHLHLGVDSRWAGDFGCRDHSFALVGIAMGCADFRLCICNMSGLSIRRFQDIPESQWFRPRLTIGGVAGQIRAGRIKPIALGATIPMRSATWK